MSLKKGHRPTEEFVTIRARAAEALPGGRVLLPAGRHRHPDPQLRAARGDRRPVHRQRDGGNARLAAELVKKIRQIPGAVDVHLHQRFDAPAVNLQMDRTRLQQMGLSAQNVGQNVLVSLSGSSQTAPAFWLNPQNGVVYQIAVQAPQYRVDSLDSLLNVPVAGRRRGARRRASSSATWSRRRRRASRRSSRATTSRPRSTSTPASRAPTWRASPPRWRRWSTRSGPSCRAAAR